MTFPAVVKVSSLFQLYIYPATSVVNYVDEKSQTEVGLTAAIPDIADAIVVEGKIEKVKRPVEGKIDKRPAQGEIDKRPVQGEIDKTHFHSNHEPSK